MISLATWRTHHRGESARRLAVETLDRGPRRVGRDFHQLRRAALAVWPPARLRLQQQGGERADPSSLSLYTPCLNGSRLLADGGQNVLVVSHRPGGRSVRAVLPGSKRSVTCPNAVP